jgi:class 3 adenylate cyclase
MSPQGFRYCGACGERLPGYQADEAGEERRLVSAVFCDVVGFTRRAETMDPEDVHHLLRVYYANVRDEFERWGGTVAKFIGDAVFALFGVPRAHEDDPERAVRAALAAIDTVADLGLDLHLHIGVTTGEALVTFASHERDREGAAWGDILNTASRLESAAPPDGILVDEPTYRTTLHVIEYAAAEPVRAKGKVEPVDAWRPLGPVARRGMDPDLTDAARPPLVDRSAELETLLDALEDLRAHRPPRLITLLGDAGIGKSRLVLELFRRVEAGHELINWRHGRSPPHPADVGLPRPPPEGRSHGLPSHTEGAAFWALGEIVKGQAGILESDTAATAASKLRSAVRELVPAPREAARIEGHLRSLVGFAQPDRFGGDERLESFAAWRHFLEALARRRPLILVFEDLHWADQGLVEFIEHLVDTTQESLLVLCTARSLPRAEDWDATILGLEPLSDEETRRLVRSLAPASAVPDELATKIIANAAGNPLYSVEFVRMLAGRAPDEPLSVPPSVWGIIAERLDALAPEDKWVLQAGSVVGRIVWPGALAACTGRSRQWVSGRLRELEHRQFLARMRRSSVEQEPQYRFQHILIRDVAYGQLSHRHRGELHLRAAEWLESLSPDRAGDRAEMLAHHYQRALAFAGGHVSAELEERTRLALRDAGDRALALQAFPAAARFFRHACELCPPGEPERPWLLFGLAKAVYYAELEGADELAEARDALLAAGDRGAAAEAEALLGNLAHHRGHREEELQHLERAEAMVEGLGPSRSKAQVLADLANSFSRARAHARTMSAGGQAVELAKQLGLRDVQATALSAMGISRGLAGDLGGRDDLRQSIAIANEIDSVLSAHGAGMLADLECQVGNLETCFELQEAARRQAERFGHARFVRWLRTEQVGERYWTGAWREATALADSLLAEIDSRTPNFMESHCRAMRGRIRLACADPVGAVDDADRALAFAQEAQAPQLLYPALAFAALAHVIAGSAERGAKLASMLLTLWQTRIDAYPASYWAVDLGIALDALGRGTELLEVAGGIADPTRWLDAVVPFLLGDFAAAAEGFRRVGSKPDEALAQLRAAQALLVGGRIREAHEALQQARAFFRRVGARTRLLEADAIARALVVADA